MTTDNADNIEEQRHVAAELVALTLIADGVLANRELDALDRHGIAELLGVSRDALMRAVIAHCDALLGRRSSAAAAVRLVDIERFEMMLDRITAPRLRKLICRAMLVLCKADGTISLPEQTLLREMFTRWQIPLERAGGDPRRKDFFISPHSSNA